MSRKAKYSIEQKIQASEEYLSGKRSAREIGQSLRMGKNGDHRVREWASTYRENGIEGFHLKPGNGSYTAEQKQKAVEDYLTGKGSLQELSRKYKIPSTSTLRNWIKVYNSNRELRGYDPKPEVYVAMPKKTTQEERQEIVKYCLEHGKDYKGTAEKYGASYGQVYQWVKKYLKSGEEGLSDGRGHRKSDEEVDEVERLRRENLRLKAELQRKDMLVELLKKVKEFEGM